MLLSSFFISPLVDGLLLLLAAFALLWITYLVFFKKFVKKDAEKEAKEQELMNKIDEAFPLLEQILKKGIEVEAVDDAGKKVDEPRRLEFTSEDKQIMTEIAVTDEVAEQTALDFDTPLGGINTDGLSPEDI